jgi:hypothetical protein
MPTVRAQIDFDSIENRPRRSTPKAKKYLPDYP